MKQDLNNKKILLMSPPGIGDFTMNLGMINVIKNSYPKAIIDILVTNKATKEIGKFNKNTNKTYKLNFNKFTIKEYFKYFLFKGWQDIRKINKQKYDMLICPSINPLRRYLIWGLLFPKKVILKKGPHDVLREYSILDKLNIKQVKKENFLNDNGKIKKINPKEEIINSLSKNKKNIIINMFCADSPNSIRDWDKWGDLIEELSKKYNLILIGRVNFNYKKYYSLDYFKVIDLINKTKIDEIIYLIKKSDLVITIDSFPFHLAYAIGTSVIGLFGPDNPKTKIPPILDKKNIHYIYKKVGCNPCLVEKHRIKCRNKKNTNICMKKIYIKEIINKIDLVLDN